MENLREANVKVDGILLGEVPMPKEMKALYDENCKLVEEGLGLNSKMNVIKSKLKIVNIKSKQLKRKAMYSEITKKIKGNDAKGVYNSEKNTMRIYDASGAKKNLDKKVDNSISKPESKAEDINLPEIFKNSQAFKHLT